MKTTKEQRDAIRIASNDDWPIKSESVLGILDDLDTALGRVKVLEDALEKIKDGGVEPGVLANVHERMLVMCELSTEALARSRALGESKDEPDVRV